LVSSSVMASSSMVKMGSCLKANNMQELVKSKPGAEPERYIRPKQERIGCSSLNAPASLQIPIIDMGRIVLNHGTGHWQLLERIKKVVMEFFKLPLEEKE
ncbi:hypothetical protein KI387_002068, partial [Taxus chinensis]